MNETNVLTNEEVKKLIGGINHEEIISREASLSWDGRNILVRIPKEISEYLGLDEKNRFKKNLKFTIEIKRDVIKKSFEIVERTKPKKAVKK